MNKVCDYCEAKIKGYSVNLASVETGRQSYHPLCYINVLTPYVKDKFPADAMYDEDYLNKHSYMYGVIGFIFGILVGVVATLNKVAN